VELDSIAVTICNGEAMLLLVCVIEEMLEMFYILIPLIDEAYKFSLSGYEYYKPVN
jgi:hypothetical protein